MTRKSSFCPRHWIGIAGLIGQLLLFIPVIAQDNSTADAYLDRADRYVDAGQYDRAYETATLAYEQYTKNGPRKGVGKALLLMGMAEQFQKHFKEALAHYLKAQSILEVEMSEAELTASGLYNRLGGVYTDLGYRYEGRQFLEKAYELCRRYSAEDSSGTATVHYNLGLSSIYYGETRLALQHFLQALPVYLREYGENGNRVAQLYNNVGILYRDLGEYDRAIEYYERAIAIHVHNAGDRYWNLAYPYLGMATVFENTGDSVKALRYHELVLALCRENRDKLIRVESIAHGAVAIHYAGVGAFDKSLSHANTAIEIMKRNYREDHPRLNDYYMIIGDVYQKKGSFNEATYWYQLVINNVKAAYGSHHPSLANVYQKLARIQSLSGHHTEALLSIEAGIASLVTDTSEGEDLDKMLDPRIYLRLLVERAQIYRRRAASSNQPVDDWQLALVEFERASEVIDHIRRGYLSEEAKLFLQGNAVGIYEEALAVAYDLLAGGSDGNYLERAFFFMEKSKAAILSESLQSHYLKEVKGIPPSLLRTESDLVRKVKTLQTNLQESTEEERDSIQQLVFRAKVSADSLQDVVRRQYPHYYDLKYDVDVLSLAEMQGTLSPGSAGLTYFEGDTVWYAMVVHEKTARLLRLPKTEEMERNVEDFLRLVRDPASSVDTLHELSAKLTRHLIAEPLQSMGPLDRLIIVPDGSLGYVPFEALSNYQKAAVTETGYLIDQYIISYTPSMTLYHKKLESGGRFEENYVGFAPVYNARQLAMVNDAFRDELAPLPGSVEEVRFVGNLFSGATYLDAAASENNFKKMATSSRIIHLAMHAIADDADPMHSRLLFGDADGEDDGSLNAYELYNLRLRSDIVVLSACNTGVGALRRGEGILSLSRAFMYAGSPKVVMSLWRAKDQPTSAIVRNFFVGVKNGQQPDASLRQAKLSYLRSADPFQSHPANWATFIVIGNGQELTLDSSRWGPWTIGVLVVLFVLVVGWRRKRRHGWQKPASAA